MRKTTIASVISTNQARKGLNLHLDQMYKPKKMKPFNLNQMFKPTTFKCTC